MRIFLTYIYFYKILHWVFTTKQLLTLVSTWTLKHIPKISLKRIHPLMQQQIQKVTSKSTFQPRIFLWKVKQSTRKFIFSFIIWPYFDKKSKLPMAEMVPKYFTSFLGIHLQQLLNNPTNVATTCPKTSKHTLFPKKQYLLFLYSVTFQK